MAFISMLTEDAVGLVLSREEIWLGCFCCCSLWGPGHSLILELHDDLVRKLLVSLLLFTDEEMLLGK